MKSLQSRNKKISLEKPLIMGILNVTPDSFSDGGEYFTVENALQRALQMIEEGTDIIDIGGESSGPGSKFVDLQKEINRVIPIVEKLRSANSDIWISVDTYKAEVAHQALEAGADMINDVTALRGDSTMAMVLAKYDVPVVLMFSKDSDARTTRKEVHYDDVIKTVSDFWQQRIDVAIAAGIGRDRLVLDPGMGAFVSSDPKYSLQILKRLAELKSFNLPLLVGTSRKSFIGQVLDLPLPHRLEGSLASALIAYLNGASILRVHDVKETRRVLLMAHAVLST
jgi:dihydropteroate synthase